MDSNVLLIMVDAFRADRLFGAARSCRTPVLDDLARRSTTFTNAFSTASMTTCCTASILTGTYPFVHGIRSLADSRLGPDLPTLPELFRARGYHTWAEVTGPLVPVTGLDRGFDRFAHRDSRQTLDTDWGEGFRRGLADRPGPWFGFLHLWELHNPRRVTREFAGRRHGSTLYDRAVSSLDAQLQSLFDALPDGTAIVLTGDHGEYVSTSVAGSLVGTLKRPLKALRRRIPVLHRLRGLMPALLRSGGDDALLNWLGHGYHVHDYLVHVPLVLSHPDVFPQGVERRELVSHVDLLPTLASIFDLDAGDAIPSGVDLAPLIAGEPARLADRALYLEASGGRTTPRPEQWLAAIRTERHKYVRGLVDEAIPEELYELEADPDEQRNLAAERPELARALGARLTALVEAGRRPDLVPAAAYTAEEQAELEQRLHDLGYIE